MPTQQSLRLVLFGLIMVAIVVCTWINLDQARYRHHSRVQLFSQGLKIGEWVAAGPVDDPTWQSYTWSFVDSATGRSVKVSGEVTVTPLD